MWYNGYFPFGIRLRTSPSLDNLTTLGLRFLKFKVGRTLPISRNCYENMYEYSKTLIIILNINIWGYNKTFHFPSVYTE